MDRRTAGRPGTAADHRHSEGRRGTLTGSIAGGRGGEVAIKEGTISGNTLKFKSTQQGRGGEVNMSWSGTLKGDEIAFSRAIEGGTGQAQEFTLKRQK